MRHRAAVLLGVVLLAAGCAHPPPVGFAPGTSMHTIKVGGAERTYRLYQPEGLPATAPLVVMLHGGFGSARQAENSYDWDDVADAEKFVVAYPDGLHRAWNTNGGGCCGRSARDGVDDIAFISAAVADVEKNVRIDPARIYATGMSNGAIMAYTMACHTALFAAIGPVSGTQLDPCRTPRPTSVMHIHGTGDPMVPYSGGSGTGVARINGPPVEQLNAFWRNVDHCTAPSASASGSITTSAADCAQRRSVVLVTVGDGGHEWPSMATEMLWQFFAQHPG
ncbi:PHB depolymerase family esterase [Mycobacterium sp. 1423905.2]|uniref:extracellular catalytic domain type 1 short-chain-length polyhydroxyalkanoate depolymerase n=1 Tax=Mycobacterium sp. 1423905.2 TaxID=1856859 RepID=UPI0008003D8F|nr:PHB depolymerase family esterase [Mycobacterium sp. 1423905.2]OBJ60724.1 polyhydroxybutyrate depolymerase [Mycobacterium sp. 1423905.2]